MGFSDFLLGSTTATDRQNDMWNKLTNYDNRKNDFELFAGEQLNGLANRGVINSTVGSNAMARGLDYADKNYWNNQMNMANLAFQQQDSGGLLQGLLSGGAQAAGTAAGMYMSGGLGAMGALGGMGKGV